MTIEMAKKMQSYHNDQAVQAARRFIDNGWNYDKDMFARHEQLAKRYDWARWILMFRQICTAEEMQEKKRRFPGLYRVRAHVKERYVLLLFYLLTFLHIDIL